MTIEDVEHCGTGLTTRLQKFLSLLSPPLPPLSSLPRVVHSPLVVRLPSEFTYSFIISIGTTLMLQLYVPS